MTEGRGETFVSPAGRLLAADPNHTFEALARQIDAAFARWDTAHLHQFELADGTRIGPLTEDSDERLLDEKRIKLSCLRFGEAFSYTFDFGDMWFHQCMVEESPIAPTKVLGLVPASPTPYFGWGSIPDQYGRASMDDASG